MDLNFDEIALSRNEQRALKKLQKSDALIEKQNASVFTRLFEAGLIEIIPAPDQKSDFGLIPKKAHINHFGKSYRAYLSSQKKIKNRAVVRDVVFLVLGTILGVVGSLLYDLIHMRIQQG